MPTTIKRSQWIFETPNIRLPVSILSPPSPPSKKRRLESTASSPGPLSDDKLLLIPLLEDFEMSLHQEVPSLFLKPRIKSPPSNAPKRLVVLARKKIDSRLHSSGSKKNREEHSTNRVPLPEVKNPQRLLIGESYATLDSIPVPYTF
jgi:hypothetical protein